MIEAELVARLVLAGVLAWSARTKIAAPALVEEASAELGVPPVVASWVARLLAPLELAIALMLLFSLTVQAGAIAALLLFVSFTALLGWNLARGRRPACACFGEASTTPISGWTLARNVALIGLALLVAAPGAAHHVGIVGLTVGVLRRFGVEASIAVLLLLSVVQVALALALLGRGRPAPSTEAHAASPDVAPAPVAEGWPPGTRAPLFDLPGSDGERVTLRRLLDRGRHVVLVFTDPACRPCTALLPEIGRWQEQHADTLSVAVISRGSPAANRDLALEHGVASLLLQGDNEVAAAYRAAATPSALVVSPEGRILTRVASGGTPVRALVNAWSGRSAAGASETVHSPPPPPEPVLLGDPAPPFRLPATSGQDVDLFELGGRPVLLIFWSPTCGYCRALLPELRTWERSDAAGWCHTLVLSTGGGAAAEADGFLSPVLLDEGGQVAHAYGSTGTPGAVLVDAEGRVASGVATGSEAVLALARRGDALSRAVSLLTQPGRDLPA